MTSTAIVHFPLKERICRPSHYKSYSNSHVEHALNAIKKGSSSHRAAEEFGIPRSTFHDYASGKVQIGKTNGLPKYWNDEEESRP